MYIGHKFESSLQKLAIFRKVKSKIPDFERGKSRNYAEMYKWYVAQAIPKIDPREMGSAFHGAGAETCPLRVDWIKRPFLDGNYLVAFNISISIALTLGSL
jgi:hypothetical protein